jgi:hypothetical protein
VGAKPASTRMGARLVSALTIVDTDILIDAARQVR